jgi:hypothetical protein
MSKISNQHIWRRNYVRILGLEFPILLLLCCLSCCIKGSKRGVGCIFLVEVNTRFHRRKNTVFIFLAFSVKTATGIQYLSLCLSSNSGSEQIFSWFNLEYSVVSQNVPFFYEVIRTKVYLPFTLYVKLGPNSDYRVLMYFSHRHTHQCVFMTLVISLVTWTTIKCDV